MKIIKNTILILFLACVSLKTYSWNARGHMIVAAIAYIQLNQNQKEQITELLKYHPDYHTKWSKDYKKVKNEMDLGQFLMMRASIWPDEIRSESNANFRFHRPEWHYITYRINFNNGHDTTAIDGNNEPNVVWASEHARRMIENKTLDNASRAMFFAWFIHLTGDIHQPLHCGSLFNSTYPKGDKGGNDFFIKLHTTGLKLHGIWDGALGSEGTGKEPAIKNQSLRIKSDTFQFATLFDLNRFNPRQWSLESFNHSVNEVHLNGNLNGSTTKEAAIMLPENYTKSMKRLSEQRCLLAGIRLGNTINDLRIASLFYNHDD